jgi:hypothetical protein
VTRFCGEEPRGANGDSGRRTELWVMEDWTTCISLQLLDFSGFRSITLSTNSPCPKPCLVHVCTLSISEFLASTGIAKKIPKMLNERETGYNQACKNVEL